MNKYYEGSIYTNYYLDGIAGILGSVLSICFYGLVKMRWSFFISVTVTLIGAVFLLVFQQDYLSPHWITAFLREPSPYEEDSPQDKEYNLGYVIPLFVFIAKLGVNTTF